MGDDRQTCRQDGTTAAIFGLHAEISSQGYQRCTKRPTMT